MGSRGLRGAWYANDGLAFLLELAALAWRTRTDGASARVVALMDRQSTGSRATSSRPSMVTPPSIATASSSA
ncbi:hypothetical protein P3T35_003561 [Kitasatospora sp. GP30]|nr:hypothetical protein [Kitasatospora sp. GP30]